MAATPHRGTLANRWWSATTDALISVLFPAQCRLCESLLVRASRIPICDACLEVFSRIRGAICERCGLPASEWSLRDGVSGEATSDTSSCPTCRDREYGFDRARSFGNYRGPLVKAIMLLKFDRIEPLAGWFADRLVEVARQNGISADVVVPVPLYRQRERERGYNQANLIARPLAKELGLPYRPLLLVRTKPRPDKHILSLEERWDSVRGAFATRPGTQVDNVRVLLVDDVMTTGATLDACARALGGAGAKSVVGLTVARAARNPV